MNEKVLLVDDDANILKAYERRLRKKFDIETALCSEEGLTAVNFLGPFAVVVSDMAMPRENGAEFLQRILKLAPDSVRIMLTGNADQKTAADAVNIGRVFRFLNKPCEAEALEAAIADGIHEHNRLATERELLSQTVHGCIGMLTKVMSLVSPVVFGRASRLRELVGRLAGAAEMESSWEVVAAASLSQIGSATAPHTLLDKLGTDEPLSAEEGILWARRYVVAAELIAEAPRLERVARMVSSLPDGLPEEDDERLALEIGLLRLAIDFDTLTTDQEVTAEAALSSLCVSDTGERPPHHLVALGALRKLVAKGDQRRLLDAKVDTLRVGYYLVDDVVADGEAMLVSKGQLVSDSMLEKLGNYSENYSIREPIRVLAPPSAEQETSNTKPDAPAVVA